MEKTVRFAPLKFVAAAGFAVVPSAGYAADLAVAPAPVDYVRVCDAFGDGFFYLPGTETCLRVGGRIRAEISAQQFGDSPNFWDEDSDISTRFRARGYARFDARTHTEYGILRNYLSVVFQNQTGTAGDTATIEFGFIQFGGLTAGRAQSVWDYWTGYAFGVFFTDYTDIKQNLFSYTQDFGNGFSATLSVEDGTRRRTNIARLNAAGTSLIAANAYGGHRMPDFVAALRVDQGWGSAQVMGALHQVTYDRSTFQGTADSELGFAIGAGVTVNAPFVTNGAVFLAEAIYTDGASQYGIDSWNGQITDAVVTGNSLETTETWNFAAGYRQPVFTDWEIALEGGYHQADAGLRAYDFAQWGGNATLTWQPVPGFLMGAEVGYQTRDFTRASGLSDGDFWVSTFRVQRTF